MPHQTTHHSLNCGKWPLGVICADDKTTCLTVWKIRRAVQNATHQNQLVGIQQDPSKQWILRRADQEDQNRSVSECTDVNRSGLETLLPQYGICHMYRFLRHSNREYSP